ncbi:type II toxin-antitoxin system RelE/ParE family toxin [Helicobacter labetoulli]|uniref:type II toxin-antitoxin system RelE/ParE family toxin n=1 Tax=Helicobacter labetoulli TaxID=2315333 RepID=UPI000EF6ADFE|nr:type II toxin-antitoxin system RelE/ParE family toxin [Helicobacter labetoulli]
MVIYYSIDFIELENIISFIAKDSQTRADEFSSTLRKKIESIPEMPYRFRQNQILQDENIRDLIYKGYVVVFAIEQDSITILGIFKHNIWEKDSI